MKEAQYYCSKKAECTGISYSNIEISSGDNSVGYVLGYGYQLRKGSLTKSSSSLSWVKQAGEVANPASTGTTTST